MGCQNSKFIFHELRETLPLENCRCNSEGNLKKTILIEKDDLMISPASAQMLSSNYTHATSCCSCHLNYPSQSHDQPNNEHTCSNLNHGLNQCQGIHCKVLLPNGETKIEKTKIRFFIFNQWLDKVRLPKSNKNYNENQIETDALTTSIHEHGIGSLGIWEEHDDCKSSNASSSFDMLFLHRQRQLSRSLETKCLDAMACTAERRASRTVPVMRDNTHTTRPGLLDIFGQEAMSKYVSATEQRIPSPCSPESTTDKYKDMNFLEDDCKISRSTFVMDETDISMFKTNGICAVSYGSATQSGLRSSNEDRHVSYVRTDEFSRLDIGIFAIYDGHNGSDVSEYLSQYLHKKLLELIDTGKSIYSAILDCTSIIDNEIYSKKLGGGSTAVVMVLIQDEIIMFSVGDSNALVSSNKGKARKQFISHKVTVPTEYNRIIKANGKVINGRVLGILNVTRSFGDNDFKTSKNEYKNRFKGDLVTCEPCITEQRKINHEDEFIVLVSDGILEAMSTADVISFVYQQIRMSKNLNDISKLLIDHAMKHGCEDNATAIIVCFFKYADQA